MFKLRREDFFGDLDPEDIVCDKGRTSFGIGVLRLWMIMGCDFFLLLSLDLMDELRPPEVFKDFFVLILERFLFFANFSSICLVSCTRA